MNPLFLSAVSAGMVRSKLTAASAGPRGDHAQAGRSWSWSSTSWSDWQSTSGTSQSSWQAGEWGPPAKRNCTDLSESVSDDEEEAAFNGIRVHSPPLMLILFGNQSMHGDLEPGGSSKICGSGHFAKNEEGMRPQGRREARLAYGGPSSPTIPLLPSPTIIVQRGRVACRPLALRLR